MKKTYLLILTAMLTVVSATQAVAQHMIVNQVIVGSGGVYGDTTNFVTIAAYSPTTGITTVFDTIYTQSVQSIIIENEVAYVAAQDSIVKYNLNNYARIAETEAIGVNKLAVSGNTLIASFWYPVTSGYVKTYSAEDLSPIHIFDSVSGEAAGTMIMPGGHTAVVAVPGGWGSTGGKLAWLDIENNELLGESSMSDYGDGVNFLISYTSIIPKFAAITVTPWGDSTFYYYGFDAIGNTTEVYSFDAYMFGYTGMANGMLYAKINGGIGQLDLETLELDTNLIIDPPSLTISGTAFDSINNWFYIATTDYTTTGIGKIYNLDGDSIGHFDANISPEAIAIDYRDNTGINNLYSETEIKIYPNPSSNVITVEVSEGISSDKFNVVDISGRVLINAGINLKSGTANIDISSLQSGLYFLILSDGNSLNTSPFVKK